jgi:hypothetical protein
MSDPTSAGGSGNGYGEPPEGSGSPADTPPPGPPTPEPSPAAAGQPAGAEAESTTDAAPSERTPESTQRKGAGPAKREGAEPTEREGTEPAEREGASEEASGEAIDTGSLGVEPTGALAGEVDEQPLAASEEHEIAGAQAGLLTGGQGTAERPVVPRSHRRARDGSAVGHIREPELHHFWRSWLGRAIALLVGVLLLGTAFIASYVGALHDPSPKELPVAVVEGDSGAASLVAAVRSQAGPVLLARQYPDAGAAARALRKRTVFAVLSSSGSATAPGISLTVAGAAAPGAAEAITQAVTAAATAGGISLVVRDAYPLSANDPRGLAPFYTVVGLLVGGYLAATALAVILGTVPRDLDRLGLRLAAFAVFALLLGLAGALLVGPAYDIWSGRLLGLWLAGALITFVGAVVTAALEAWLGLIGTGVALLLLVVVGNPGSGAIFAPQFLPAFYGTVHWWNPTGQASDLLRGVAYFDRHAIGGPLLGLVGWALVAVLGVLGATAALGRRVHGSR